MEATQQMFHRSILIAIVALCTACGGSSDPSNDGTSSSSSSGGDTQSQPDGQASETDASGLTPDDAGTQADATTSDADSSTPVHFSADCAGSVTQGGTAAWSYTVDDSSGSSQIHATVQVDAPGAPLCTGDATFTAPAAFSDWVTVACGAGNWTFGLDRTTMKVDIRYNSPQGTQASWLPNCR